MSYFNGLQGLETAEYLTDRIDKLGGPESYNHYAVGWAHAMDTPYQWTKQVASIGAARATALSSTGPRASKPRARYAPSSPMSSTWHDRP